MIKEYDDVRMFIETTVSGQFLDGIVSVGEMYTNEYNALELNIVGDVDISNSFYINLKKIIKTNFPNIVQDFEIMDKFLSNHTGMIIYLNSTMDIRSDKIHKIKSNILI